MKEFVLPNDNEIVMGKLWFKVVEFGVENWALVQNNKEDFTLYFFDVSKSVFDSLNYKSEIFMKKELIYNGYEQYEKEAIPLEIPSGEFHISEQINRRIYSSGKFWKTLPDRLREKYGESPRTS